MRIQGMLFAMTIALMLAVSVVSAIPESDLYKFRASVRGVLPFDEYMGNATDRTLTVKAFHNESEYFYFIVRAHNGDAVPYDDFFMRFQCQGDALPTELHTTDYDSWEQAGQISFKRGFYQFGTEYYDGETIDSAESWCQVYSATDLDVDGNAGYTDFYVEIAPVLDTNVITLAFFCGDTARAELTEALEMGIATVLVNNVNFLYTLWIVFQILAVIFVVMGIPILMFMLIRWVIWRVSGHKLMERTAYE